MTSMPKTIEINGGNNFATPYRINLSSSEKIRVEMSRVYREARMGLIPISNATKLVFMLTQIIKVYELCEIEQRLMNLEDIKNAQ